MLSTDQVMDRYFLDTRCMLIEIGAMLDRLDRAAEDKGAEPPGYQARLEKIHEALSLLARQDTTADRSERLLRLFSDLD